MPAAPAVPIAELLKTANAEEGAKVFKTKCTSCHNSEKGGANKVGPNLWNIVGDAKADPALGFNFSDAMKQKGGEWTYDDLNAFLANPKGFVPGTRMTFVGLKKDDERADVIAFLRADETFASSEALAAKMREDCDQARATLAKIDAEDPMRRFPLARALAKAPAT